MSLRNSRQGSDGGLYLLESATVFLDRNPLKIQGLLGCLEGSQNGKEEVHGEEISASLTGDLAIVTCKELVAWR